MFDTAETARMMRIISKHLAACAEELDPTADNRPVINLYGTATAVDPETFVAHLRDREDRDRKRRKVAGYDGVRYH